MSSEAEFGTPPGIGTEAAGPASAVRRGLRTYLIGLGLATVMTIASFWAAQTHLIYGPGISVAIVVLAIAQMGIHLVFFLHITTGPESTNNVLALAFGLLIVFVVVVGSIWIVSDLNQNMLMPSAGPMSIGAQH